MGYLENKTILITGATGFIGSHILKRLINVKNVKIVIIARKDPGHNSDTIKWIKSDICLLSRNTLIDNGISHVDIVLHLAAYTPKSSGDDDIDRIIKDNILASHALLKCLPGNIGMILYTSTLDVYASVGDDEITERTKLDPSSLYSASKLFCEKLISKWAKDNQCLSVILRYGHIYGPGEDSYNKLIPSVIKVLLDGESPVIYGTGDEERDYLYVDDAVEATLRAMILEDNIGPLNIVHGKSISVREIVDMLIKITGFNKNIVTKSIDHKLYSIYFDNTEMVKRLGKWDFVSMWDGLSSEVDSYRSVSSTVQ